MLGFSALSLGIKAATVGGILLVAVSGYVAWRSGIFNKGVAYERAQQKERDDEAVGNARQGRDHVRACYDGGGVWDASRGVCNWR